MTHIQADRVFLPEKQLLTRIHWLITLRWIAALGLFAVITTIRYAAEPGLPYLLLYSSNLCLILLNAGYALYSRRLKADPTPMARVSVFVKLQITLDLILLTFLIYLSGGSETPFVLFYVFHMVIAGILLSNRAAYLQAVLATCLMGVVVWGAEMGVLGHFHLVDASFSPHGPRNLPYALGAFTVFALTLFTTVYLSTTIINALRQRERELQEANRLLEDQDRIKSQYIYRVSHDIKGSLGAIRNCLEVVLTGITGPIPEKSREMVARARYRSAGLSQFVEDLEYLSSIRSEADIKKQELDLSELCRSIVEQFKPRADSKGITITCRHEDPALIMGNREAIEKLMEHLIANAVTYTLPQGSITVELRLSESSESIELSVRDTGMGIAETDMAHIFDDFYRTRRAKEMERAGTGLGLSIVQRVADLHGAQVHVESREADGSNFLVCFPCTE